MMTVTCRTPPFRRKKGEAAVGFKGGNDLVGLAVQFRLVLDEELVQKVEVRPVGNVKVAVGELTGRRG